MDAIQSVKLTRAHTHEGSNRLLSGTNAQTAMDFIHEHTKTSAQMDEGHIHNNYNIFEQVAKL